VDRALFRSVFIAPQ